MSVIKVKKGLNINLKGQAIKKTSNTQLSEYYAVKPTDYKNLTPKILAKENQQVKAGSPIFCDKYKPEILFTTPVSGQIFKINRGERRKILEIIIKTNEKQEYLQFKTGTHKDFTAEQIIQQLIKSGLWTKIVKRPYGTIPDPKIKPKAIHISTFDTAPLAPDYNYTLKNNIDEFQAGINLLNKITPSNLHINIDGKKEQNIFEKTKNAIINKFTGPHPAGNVGTQIHLTTPINKNETIWTINPQDVVFIGRLFNTGKLDLTKIIALAGHEIKQPQYYKIISGAPVKQILENNTKNNNIRIISGNVLSGYKIEKNNYIGAFDNIITAITEGNTYELFGWIKPGFNKYSTSKAYLSWFRKNKKWELNTNLHGGIRSFVLTGQIEKIFPMNIYPMQLLKACYADDIDMMEKLGIYEIIEEDFALCEVISETKIDMQKIINKGINLMITEME